MFQTTSTNQVLSYLLLGLVSILTLTDAGAQRRKKKTQSARKEAFSPEEQLKTFQLPPGFEIELVASEENGLLNPIDLAFDDAGRLWTQTAKMYPLDPIQNIKWGKLLELLKTGDDTEIRKEYPEYSRIQDLYQLKTKGEDKLLIIADPTKRVEGQVSTFADGLAIPQSILPYKNGAFVAHGSELLFLEDTNQDGLADKHQTILTGFGFNDSHTMSHTLVRGPAGWVHFAHGALNSGKVVAPKSGAATQIGYSKIARFSLDGEKVEVLGGGLQNIWGFHLKENGQWYGTEANDFGWSLTPLHPMMMYKGIGNQKLRDYQPIPKPFHNFRVGGTGISGLAYDENGSKGFPEKWKKVGFLANCITSTINCVVADRRADGSVISEHLTDFLTCSDDWFRPVNIEFGPDGCLYIVDWYNKIVSHNEVARDHPDRDRAHGRIWRIRHQSQKPTPIPNLITTSNNELLNHLVADIQWQKRAAWHQIADRQASELTPQLQKLVLDQSQTLSTRIVALWSLESLHAFDASILLRLTKDPDPDIRREAARSLIHFQPDITQIIALLTPLSKDPHYMVREQVLRTLGAIKKSNPDSISLLIAACVPAAENNHWGNGYETNFQRFLARKALENYPSDLIAFLDSNAAAAFPSSHLDWAAEALSGPEKDRIFIKSWKEGKRTLDADTLASISSRLKNPELFALLAPEFEKKEFLERAIEAQPHLKSSHLLKALNIALKKQIASPAPEDRALAARAAILFQSPAIQKEMREIIINLPLAQVTTQMIDVIAITPKANKNLLLNLANNKNLPQDLQLNAITKLYVTSPQEANQALTELVTSLPPSERDQIVTPLVQTHQGAAMTLALIEQNLIAIQAINTDAGHRILRNAPVKNKTTTALAKEMTAKQKALTTAADQRLTEYKKALTTIKGNPETGKAIFAACTACHMVNGQGLDIAPALDGSANRDLHHLLTAIVKPDEAFETGYRLYQVTTKSGPILEGHMYKRDDNGVTIAYMGGAKSFIPTEQIKNQGTVGRRSFMPANFGELPVQTMMDLVNYIQTLQ